jgi:hypothetical protein
MTWLRHILVLLWILLLRRHKRRGMVPKPTTLDLHVN